MAISSAAKTRNSNIYGNIFSGKKFLRCMHFRCHGRSSSCNNGRHHSRYHSRHHTWIMPGSCRNRCTSVEYALQGLIATGRRRRNIYLSSRRRSGWYATQIRAGAKEEDHEPNTKPKPDRRRSGRHPRLPPQGIRRSPSI